MDINIIDMAGVAGQLIEFLVDIILTMPG